MRTWWAAAALLASAAPAQVPAWDAAPWLADFAQLKAALTERYANLDWLREVQEVQLDQREARTEAALRAAGSDAAARAVLDRFVAGLHDGHVDLRWPAAHVAATAPSPPAIATTLCRGLGYTARSPRAGLATRLPGYRPLGESGLFPAGLVEANGIAIGTVRIEAFAPQGFAGLCESVVSEKAVPVDRPCDDACADLIVTDAYLRLTHGLEERLRALKAAGAQVLLVDLADNGGGSEWAEAAARMLSRRPLRAAPMGYVRGPHWAKQWGDLAGELRATAPTASAADKRRLLDWAVVAERARDDAAAPCAIPGCARLGRAGYATGLVDSAPAGAFDGKSWGRLVFSVAQHPYHDGVWDGPVIVLTNAETWSAAEEFAATLRDNDAAVLIGERTGGAGCGHTDGGTPVILTNSGAVFELPDCVRYRRDGSNEVSGVIPDIVTGARASDGAGYAAALTWARLPDAVARARALYGAR